MNMTWDTLEKLSKKYGESFYLLDSKKFEQNYDEFLEAFRSIYPNTFVGYSYKTNYTPKLCSIVDSKGGYAEVVSEMEYDLAMKIGVLPEMIIVNGPYKTKDTLEKFLLNGSTVNLDSFHEVDIIEKLANKNSKTNLSIGIRCNFEIDESIISRFGFDVDSKEFYDAFDKLQKISNIKIKGLHCHFSNRDIESFAARLDKMLPLTNQLFSSPPEFIDIGGGYFGKMSQSLESQFKCRAPTFKEYAGVIASKIRVYFKDLDEPKKPRLLLEPGSALVADTMRFTAKVIAIKNVRNKAIAMTSGSKFNMGLLSSTIDMPMNVYSRPTNYDKNKHYDSIDISGYTCIESDYLFKGYNGSLGVGDYIVFDNVGSYSIVCKPPFILPNVPIIEYDLKSNSYRIIKRNEDMNDLLNTFTF